MAEPIRKLCAIYTRKSTEANLEKPFNSLDAQREACEAYIRSQAHEGWSLLPGRFDDGGFSGASLRRNALEELVREIRLGNVQIVVVYKVDRLTRSLGDFAKLIELFDAHGVSFVSVTQAFNTTTSMGRLTLNVLLSFAQFEREVIGERVRDKIAASKKKGIWVGGPVPYGYLAVNKSLVVDHQAASIVREIFGKYLEHGCLRAIATSFEREGVRKVRPNGSGPKEYPFRIGAIGHLLKNRFYVGDVVYRGHIYKGQHPAIVDLGTFDAVQAKLAANRVARKNQRRRSEALLLGRIFDARGNRMSPSYSIKRGARYRYYVSQAVLQGQTKDLPKRGRIAAPEVEGLILQALRKQLGSDENQRCGNKADRAIVEEHLKRAVIEEAQVRCEFYPAESSADGCSPAEATSELLFIPWPAKNAETCVIESSALPIKAQAALLTAIAEARRWFTDLSKGHVGTISELAKREGKAEKYIRFLLPVAFASPLVLRAIVEGALPTTVTVSALAKSLPASWSEQRKRFGLH